MSLSAGSKPSSGLENDTEEQPVSGPGSAPPATGALAGSGEFAA